MGPRIDVNSQLYVLTMHERKLIANAMLSQLSTVKATCLHGPRALASTCRQIRGPKSCTRPQCLKSCTRARLRFVIHKQKHLSSAKCGDESLSLTHSSREYGIESVLEIDFANLVTQYRGHQLFAFARGIQGCTTRLDFERRQV